MVDGLVERVEEVVVRELVRVEEIPEMKGQLLVVCVRLGNESV